MSWGPMQLLILLAIVILLFGTKKLKNIGSDLGGAVRGFRSAMKEGESEKKEQANLEQKASAEGEVIEGEAKEEKDKV